MGFFDEFQRIGKKIGRAAVGAGKAIFEEATTDPVEFVATSGLSGGLSGTLAAGRGFKESYGAEQRVAEEVEEKPTILGPGGLETETAKKREEELEKLKDKRRGAPGRRQTILTRREPRQTLLGS